MLTLLSVIAFWLGLPLFDLLELKTYDIRLNYLSSTRPDAVTIAAIDEKSLASLGRWPWTRSTLARLNDRLDQLGARVIAYDVFFPEPEATDADRRLIESTAGRAVVLSTVFLYADAEIRRLGADGGTRAAALIASHAIDDLRQPATIAPGTEEPRGVLVNLPELQRAARYSGHINVMPEADGVVRRAPLVARFNGRFFPSFDVQAARAFHGGKPLTLHAAEYGLTDIDIGDRRLPLDEDGRTLIRYRGGEGSFPTVPVADILDGRADPALIRDRVVVVGSTALGIADFRSTPVGTAFPGVEIRANIIQNLLDGETLRRPDWMALVDSALMLVIGLALAWTLPRLGVLRGTAAAFGTLLAYVAFVWMLFRGEGLWLNLVYPAFLIGLLFVSSTLIHYFSSESQKRFLKNAFQFYVPREVVNEITADAGKLRLGGEKRELTVLFSDIREFTTISETLDPEDLVKLLNVYFTAMTRQVFAQRGSLDKYIGDAIMAVFGAPVTNPQHARSACLAALGMMDALALLQAEWRRTGLPVINIGIGINTGPMVVGNMGSDDRFNYTVVGDAVNVSSRIESLNKRYGTNILISEFTHAAAGELPNVREIDRVQVRGRAQPVGLYELIPQDRYPNLDWLPDFAVAYRHFREGDDAAAETGFQSLVDRVGDPVSAYHLRTLRTRRDPERAADAGRRIED